MNSNRQCICTVLRVYTGCVAMGYPGECGRGDI